MKWFAALATVFAVVAVPPVAQAQVDPNDALYAAVQCEAPQDVSRHFQGATLDQFLFGYDAATNTVGKLPDTYPVNESTYIFENFSGTLVNDGSLKAGDTFTYQLDPAARIGGFLAPSSVRVDDLWVQDAAGEWHLFATASYDATANVVTYTLTSFIEGKESVLLENTMQYLIRPDVLPMNGPHEFNSEFAGATNTFTYNVDYRGNKPEVQNNSSYSFQNAILEVDTDANTYSQVFYFNPQGVELPNGWTASYLTTPIPPANAPRTPLASDAEIKVYKMAPGDVFPDTFGVDFSTLEDVTASVLGADNTITVPGPTTDRYVIYLENRYTSTTAIDDNGREVETVNSIRSAMTASVVTAGGSTTHDAGSFIQEQTYVVSGSSTDSTLPTPVCEQPRTVTVQKTDAETGAALENAVFEVRQGGTVVATLTTDATGKAVSEALPLGDYELVEVTAPEGYVLDSTARAFTLSTTTTVFNYSVAVTNKPEPEPVPPTDPVEPEPTDPVEPHNPTLPATPPDPAEPPAPVTPSVPLQPSDPAQPSTPAAPNPQLAQTGGELGGVFVGAIALTIAGTGLVRRRSARKQ